MSIRRSPSNCSAPPPSDVTFAIETIELTKDYAVGFWRKRPKRVLDRLSLQVGAGEVFGFLGPNGAGKTTTLKLLLQLVFPTSGEARIFGRPAGDLAAKRRLGYLPENPYFYDHLTAEELLTYYGGLLGLAGGRPPPARECPARRRRHRQGAPRGAPQVLEGHAAASRHRPGAAQRAGPRHSRRADVGSRSARTPRCPGAHPAAARPRLHRVFQLARIERRRGALQPRGHPCQGPPRRQRPPQRDAGVPRPRAGSSSWPTCRNRSSRSSAPA